MTRAALVACALLCASCARHAQVKADTTLHQAAQEQHQAARASDQVVDAETAEGPVDVHEVTITGELDTSPPGLDPDGGVPALPRFKGPVTVRVRDEHRGPKTSSTKTDTHVDEQASGSSSGSSDLHGYEDSESDSHPELPRVRCGFGGSVWGLAILGAVLIAAYVLWRLKKASPIP